MEATTPCPPGGPLSFSHCGLRPFLPLVTGTAALLYVAGLSAVLAWLGRMRRRRVGDRAAARQWYLLAATLGAPIALLLAFTLVSALR